MVVKALQNYLATRLLLRLDASHLVRLLLEVFVLVFASAVVIDILTRSRSEPFELLLHGTGVGLTFAVAAALAATALFLVRNLVQHARVWHLWTISLTGFIVGHFFIRLDREFEWLTGSRVMEHAEPLGLAQLLPVWFLVTYVFVQPYERSSLKAEVSALREFNALLANRNDRLPAPEGRMIQFEAGRTRFALPADTIRNIAVDDHYCYVHFLQDGTYEKRALAIALQDVMALLPPEFIRVHRSHVVNLERVASVRRRGRSIRVLLEGDYEVPVSRYRLDEVMPLIAERSRVT